MRILITGNLGYVGSVLVPYLREMFPQAWLVGVDPGYFASCYSSSEPSPERFINEQLYSDLRDLDLSRLKGIDSIIHLAAISNDPMGSRFAQVTSEINLGTTEKLARWARENGVSNFVFASSCSVYGVSGSEACNEQSTVSPLTEYAKSKVEAEKILSSLSTEKFRVKCLRFATACGASPRLRLDLVLNDFVASAHCNKKIQILSDGTPWRPLIHVEDMARALAWAVSPESSKTSPYFLANVGMSSWNFKVIELAQAVCEELPGVTYEVNPNAAPDKRSYRVDFSLFEKNISDRFALRSNLGEVIRGLHKMVAGMNIPSEFRNSRYVRLNVLRDLQEGRIVDESLRWIS